MVSRRILPQVAFSATGWSKSKSGTLQVRNHTYKNSDTSLAQNMGVPQLREPAGSVTFPWRSAQLADKTMKVMIVAGNNGGNSAAALDNLLVIVDSAETLV
jgi:hypothetical protein